MVSAGEATTFLIYLERVRACRIDASGDIFARLDSKQIAERHVCYDNSTFRILRNSDTNRQDLHDRLKFCYPLLELSIEIANLLFGCYLSAYIRAGAKPSHQVSLRVADGYSASKKPAILPLLAK